MPPGIPQYIWVGDYKNTPLVASPFQLGQWVRFLYSWSAESPSGYRLDWRSEIVSQRTRSQTPEARTPFERNISLNSSLPRRCPLYPESSREDFLIQKPPRLRVKSEVSFLRSALPSSGVYPRPRVEGSHCIQTDHLLTSRCNGPSHKDSPLLARRITPTFRRGRDNPPMPLHLMRREETKQGKSML
ncbi:hypothetical protein AB3S75_037254 [Citrus x aurantiifolia]